MCLFELCDIRDPVRLANCQEPSKIAITNISVVDVVRGGIQDGMTILVEDAKIVGVGRADSAEVPGRRADHHGTDKLRFRNSGHARLLVLSRIDVVVPHQWCHGCPHHVGNLLAPSMAQRF